MYSHEINRCPMCSQTFTDISGYSEHVKIHDPLHAFVALARAQHEIEQLKKELEQALATASNKQLLNLRVWRLEQQAMRGSR